jgi:hypothetical protein
MGYEKIHQSEYGGTSHNYHLSKFRDELRVELTYPPYTDEDNTGDQIRYVRFDQESVRASDGIRIHFDFARNAYIIEQPKHHLRKTGDGSYEDITIWVEVGCFEAWAQGGPDETDDDYRRADEEYEAAKLAEQKD